MRIDRAVIDLRPLPAHRCTELGFALARQWYGPLLRLYLVVLSPMLLACLGVAIWWPEALTLAQLALWWLKPFAELALLYWCSQALFGAVPSFRSSIVSTYKSLPRLLLNTLGLFRFSPSRGLSMCVIYLEKTPVRAGSRRLDVLSSSGSALAWVLVVGAHVEMILAAGLYLSLLYFIPFETALTESFADRGVLAWVDHLESNVYMLCVFAAQLAFAPFFVCASFVHYINRRSRLEAWDIQHSFKALNARVASEATKKNSQRVAPVALALMFAGLLALSAHPRTVLAETAADASQRIEHILSQERFGHYSEGGRLQLKDNADEPLNNEADYDFSWLQSIVDYFNDMPQFSALRWLGLLLIAVIVIKLLIRFYPSIRELLTALASPRWQREHADDSQILVDAVSFAEARRQMLGGHTREALSCLLRAVLSSAQQHQEVDILPSYTEAECEREISRSMDPPRYEAFRDLLQLWRAQAYESKQVSSVYADRVIDRCEAVFSSDQS